jgi:hypothetical protein
MPLIIAIMLVIAIWCLVGIGGADDYVGYARVPSQPGQPGQPCVPMRSSLRPRSWWRFKIS